MPDEILTYAKAMSFIKEWLPYSDGQSFTADKLWQMLGVRTLGEKHDVQQVLSNLKKDGTLDGVRGQYRFVNTEIDELKWVDADPKDILDIKWPIGIDGTDFGFDDNLTLYPKSIFVASGVSNKGKTGFMFNIAVRNMDAWKERGLRYLTSEMGPEEFRDRMDRFEEVGIELCDNYGQPKFQVGQRHDNYQDVILPDGLTIIDYLDPGENPFLVGQQIDAIFNKLNRGVVFIALQKKVQTVMVKGGGTKQVVSDYGTGGQYSEHRARIVLHIENGYIFVKKAKKCRIKNLNLEKIAFDIEDGGAHFRNIRPYVEDE